ncbi:izumo sperm-egg fusion protein 1 isoform X1 [Ailuropoda melanoleuca]|uniref:izumo sperm-egg fusion protein 1 isoform X1 n=1 Tax=Ailuropoda melanoleuca TaxID=9646 RepID=UPI00149430C0|nr:izumo sperm-egg fusion protein 1 isoform X1 [Ailuropoda melanoleuca]
MEGICGYSRASTHQLLFCVSGVVLERTLVKFYSGKTAASVISWNDEPTLEKAAWSFVKDLTRITESNVRGELLVKELYWMLHLQKDIFARFAAQFQKEAFCPNKCGTMLQSLIWCNTCQKQVHTCRKSSDCGVREITVHEMEDLRLNCELSWHRLSQGLASYNFFRVWGTKSETLLYTGNDHTLTKPAVTAEDAGVYRCSLDTVSSGPATIIHYHVRVLPRKPFQDIPSAGEASGVHPTPTQCPKSENVLRGRLIALLIWGSVVLIIGFATAILCFRPEKVINSIKSWFNKNEPAKEPVQEPAKEPAKPPHVPKEKATRSGLK